jgi:hypothetical protein
MDIYGIRIVHRLNHFTRFYGYSTRLISVMQFLHIIKSGQVNTVIQAMWIPLLDTIPTVVYRIVTIH